MNEQLIDRLKYINNIKLSKIYDFKNYIRTEIDINYEFNSDNNQNINSIYSDKLNKYSNCNISKKLIDYSNTKDFNFTDRKNALYIKMAKIKGILFDINILDSNYNEGKQELLIINGYNRIEILIYNIADNIYIEVITLVDEIDDFFCLDFVCVNSTLNKFKTNDNRSFNENINGNNTLNKSNHISEIKKNSKNYLNKETDASNNNQDNTENYNKYFILVGGDKGAIRVLFYKIHSTDYTQCELIELKNLLGHRDSINDIKINPIYNDLCLTASKDNSIRLWNYTLGIQLCIFGGKEGHEVMVLSLDWHFLGKTFVSGGGDRIKIWELPNEVFVINEDPKLLDYIYNENDSTQLIKYYKDLYNNNYNYKQNCSNNVKISYSNKKDIESNNIPFRKVFIPILSPFPIYSIDIHCSYVDSIIYIGDTIISKSLNELAGEIIEWAPFRFNQNCSKYNNNVCENNIADNLKSLDNQGFSYMIINKYEFPLNKIEDKLDKIFYFKMSFNEEYNCIVLGNNEGKVFFFKRHRELSQNDYVKNKRFFKELKPLSQNLDIYVIEGTIRKAILMKSNIVYSINDYGSIVRFCLK